MAAVTARGAPHGGADARRSPRCGCAQRLDKDVPDSPLGNAGWPLTH